MSVSTLAHPPRHGKALTKFWLGILLVVAAGIGLAWLGAESVRSQTVQVETITAGSGPQVKAVDGVYVEYEGRLPDGAVFDSSARHGGPQPMIAGQVIPGFAQALVQMQKGGRYLVNIPAKLAYGAEPPAGSPIPPNADLEFDVHIVDVAPDAALMMGAQGAGPQGQPPQGQPQQGQPPQAGAAPPQPE